MNKITKRAFLSLLGGGAVSPLLSFGNTTLSNISAPERGDSIDGLVTGGSGGVRLPFVMRGARDTSRVALTYDDGPTPSVTEAILDTLAATRARATFFVIGQRVKAYPNLARRIIAEGHEIANHSYTHPDLGKMSDAAVRSELERTQKVIEDVCGVTPKYFRPPYGSFRSTQGAIARALKLQVIIWSVDPQDWRKPGANVIASRITGSSSGGDIILCHDLHPQTATASSSFVPVITGRFTLVPLAGLLAA